MYKRRIKRTVSASPVAIRTQNTKSSNEPITSGKKLELDIVSNSGKENIKIPRERKADQPLPPSRQKSCNAVLQTEVSQNSGTKVRNMRFASQEKQVPYFEKILSSCGFNLHNSEAYVLSEDQTIFIQDLKNKLERNSSFPLNVTGPHGFIPTLEEFFSDPENLKKSLQLTKSPESSQVWRSSQDSLMHLLLSVDFLQKRLIEFLFEKLVEFVCSNEREASSTSYPWTQMILRQFKFLDHIVDPDEFLSLLFDVLSSVPEKGDVLFCLPDIILDSQHEETAKKLSELLLWNTEMSPVTPSILDGLTNLTLTPELQKTVSENVMNCLGSVQLDYLPNMVRFLVTVANSDEMPKIVSSFRQHLDFTSPLLLLAGSSNAPATNSKGPTSVENCELLTVEVLKFSVMSSRTMAESWLNAIKGVHSASKHKPLDLIMLLVIHANVPVARPTVQALFKSKARLGIFREKLLASTFSTMLVVIKEYRSALMEILFVLLKSPDPAVVDHASCWYKLCLLHLPSWQAQAVVQRLLLHVGTGSAGTMRAALSVLTTLAMENLSTLLPHQWLLLNLLDKVPDVDASVVEMIMEMLCRVAFGSETHSGSAMDDNILMLARKQLTSWSPEVRKKGVIGAILAAKHMASNETEKDSAVEGNIKQAIELMEWVTASTECPDAIGLFLDKLSSVLCSVEVLNENFLSWITDYIGQSFEEKYVVPRKGLTFEEDLKLMFNLEDPEEDEEDDICIPLAHLVDRDCLTKQCQFPPVVTMPASLRLVRCVKYLTCEGNLGDIAALLTCPVLMPCVVEQEDGLDFSCPQEQNFLLDCIFHCVNWFRELISAFAYQKNAELRRCVLLRLQSLVDMQRKLTKWLTFAIDYVPPPCQFFASAKPPKPSKAKKSAKKKGKKRRKKSKKGKKRPRSSDANENAEGEEDAEDEEEEEVQENDDEDDVLSKDTSIIKSSSIDLADYRGFLRELDVDVVILLTEKLDLFPAEGSAIIGLTPPVLLFLLQDLTYKVEYLLAPEAKRISALKTAASKPVGFANLETFAPRSFARNTIKLLPALTDKLEAIGGFFQTLLDKSDNIRDAPSMFPEGSSDIKLCYSYILRILAGLFHWSGFESKVNIDSLKDALKLLVVRDNKQAAENDRVQGLLVDAATYIMSYLERTLVLSAACSLVKLLTAFCHLVDGDADKAMHKQIENACKTFLGQRWYNLKGSEEKGADFNQHVDTLIKSFFSNIINKLETVTDLVPVVYQEMEHCVKLGSKDWSLDTFPTITKSNFTLLYRALCSALVQGLEEKLEECANDGARLKAWESAIESLRGLMMIARNQNTRSNSVAFVKNALRLLRTFLKRGLPVFIQHFRSKTNQVTSVLSTLQKSTRFLNSICYHSKSTKDATLTSLVPALRFVLEQIVVSVRTMLAKNNCRDAFWIGILKNRNLKGEEVLSQESEPAAEEEPEQDTELPSDDDSDVDVDLANPAEREDDENDDAGSSMSEVF